MLCDQVAQLTGQECAAIDRASRGDDIDIRNDLPRGHIEKGRVAHWQVTLKLGFTLDDE